MRIEINTCPSCDTITGSVVGRTSPMTVPGALMTWMQCEHEWVNLGFIDGRALVHLAMSTVLRHGVIDQAHRDTIHIVQRNLKISGLYRRSGWPQRVIDGHDVTPGGLVMARLAAARIAGYQAASSDAANWRAAANLLKVKLPG